MTVPIGEFETPEVQFVVDSYQIQFESRYQVAGSLPLTVSSDTDQISIGESVSLSYETRSAHGFDRIISAPIPHYP